MSKIEVNTVEPQCGTTLTLGASGDTVALGSGASQTGFGRTGTVDWITTPKVTGDSPVTGVTGKGYFLNTTAGTITINLPAGAAGSIVSLADYAGTWQTNNVTVTPNGSEKMGGANASVSLSTEGQSVTFVYVDSTQGWINTMDSTSNVRGSAFITATGGTPCAGTISGDYKIHKFTGPGTFAVTNAAACAADNVVSYMVVAGGGAGSTGSTSPGSYGQGGGGAGGFRELVSPTAPYTASPLDGYPSAPNRITVSATPYTITVGGGGAVKAYPASPGAPAPAENGNNSTFSSITSTGGGAGGSGCGPVADNTGNDGGGGAGSGGVEPGSGGGAGSGNTPPTTPAQGTNGGAGHCAVTTAAGGGGGATTAGQTGGPAGAGGGVGGIGGAGATTEISTASVVYAGGGGGGSGYPGPPPSQSPAGAGGAGGGGAGNGLSPSVGGVAGSVNTGGGGGGGGSIYTNATAKSGGAGGSGIVYIRYKFQ